MHLFDAQDKLKKYESVTEIIDDYFGTRLELFQTRKDYLILALQKELNVLQNKVRYITELLEGTIDLRRMKKEAIREMMENKSYDWIDGDHDYKYLIKMSMDSVSDENVEKLQKEFLQKQKELADIMGTSPQSMWLQELQLLEQQYAEYKLGRERLLTGMPLVDTKKKKASVAGGKVVTKAGGGSTKKNIIIEEDN
jgi:DNA topoisomerase-2